MSLHTGAKTNEEINAPSSPSFGIYKVSQQSPTPTPTLQQTKTLVSSNPTHKNTLSHYIDTPKETLVCSPNTIAELKRYVPDLSTKCMHASHLIDFSVQNIVFDPAVRIAIKCCFLGSLMLSDLLTFYKPWIS